MRIVVDKGRCIAAGNCVMQSLDVFDQGDEDGIVVVLDERPPRELWQSVRAAAAACPAGVITLIDDEAS